MKYLDALKTFTRKDRVHFDAACEAILETAKRGHGVQDVVQLAQAIAQSGEILYLPPSLGPFGDCPSTGGAASITTLLCPLLLAATRQVRVPKVSATGSVAGAIDTLALIPGFQSKLNRDQFLNALENAGIAHTEQTETFCPADAVLFDHRRLVDMTRHTGLAAASLLGKKLAVGSPVAAFDFRIGRVGNIADSYEDGEQAAAVFFEASEYLGLKIAITLTDNSSFQCSALGRLELLDLLWSILNQPADLSILDTRHLKVCAEIAARAYCLAVEDLKFEEAASRLQDLAHNGAVLQVFDGHLKAQGSGLDALREILDQKRRRATIRIGSRDTGFWRPPDLHLLKKWVAKTSKLVASEERKPMNEIGVHLLATPGQWIESGEEVVEIGYPPTLRFSIDEVSWIAGSVEQSPISLGATHKHLRLAA